MDDNRVGTILDGRYQILERIAAGGMGVVYRGERLKLGRSVAIKFLHAWMAQDAGFLQRFELEAHAMAKLQHPNCTSVIDFGVDRNEPYVVMDLVAGEPLRKLIDRERLPVPRVMEITRQLLAGLAHAHKQGITHRDIKPDNVMIDCSPEFGDQIRILDFGLAKMRDASTGLTTGFVVGTPDYMAPEQTLAQAVDARADVYAVGVMLFEMLAGQRPFRGKGMAEVIRMHREAPPPPLRMVAPGANLSPELEAVVARALAKTPEARYSSAGELAAALEATPEGSVLRPTTGSDARAPSQPPAAAHHPGRGVLGTAATAVLGSDALIPFDTAPVVPEARVDGTAMTMPLGPVVPSGATPAPIQPATPTMPLQGHTPAPTPLPGAPTTPMSAVTPLMQSGLFGSGVMPAGSASPQPGMPAPGAGGPVSGVALAVPQSGASSSPSVVQSSSIVKPVQPTSGSRRVPVVPVAIGGDVLVAALAFALLRGSGSGPSNAVVAKNEPAAVEADAAPTDAAIEVHTEQPAPDEPPELTRIKERLKEGKTGGAIDALEKLKYKHRQNAEIRYLLGQLYFGKLWVEDGIKVSRDAIALRPEYRNDVALIKSAIIGLANDKHHYQARRFLVRDIGAPAVPYLEEAAKSHQSDRIRERAFRALQELQ